MSNRVFIQEASIVNYVPAGAQAAHFLEKREHRHAAAISSCETFSISTSGTASNNSSCQQKETPDVTPQSMRTEYRVIGKTLHLLHDAIAVTHSTKVRCRTHDQLCPACHHLIRFQRRVALIVGGIQGYGERSRPIRFDDAANDGRLAAHGFDQIAQFVVVHSHGAVGRVEEFAGGIRVPA